MDTARKTEEADDWMSLLKAARALGKSRQTILELAVKGDLKAKHIAGRTIVSCASVDAYRARQSK